MYLIITILIIVFLLFCLFGAPYLFYRSIRYFMAKQIRNALWMLVGSSVLGFVVFLATAAVSGAKTHAQWAGCSSHLKQIVLFLKMYASDHQEKYPYTFNDMISTNYLRAGDASIFACPASHTKAGVLGNLHSWSDYAYVAGLTEGDPMNCVVAFCSPENHKGEGANVAFIGGQVRWFSCHSYTNASSGYEPTFQELTNTPSLFYGTTNEIELAKLMLRTRIIYPKKQ